jgi:DNA mismatch endonuclease (patch repair protein)
MDSVSAAMRSRVMAAIASKNTRPEKKVRSILHRMGYRFTLRNRQLPGSPDVCLPRLKAAVFVHGCFWHQHRPCPLARMPKSNLAYWRPKFQRNRNRDKEAVRALTALGWRVLVIWECDLHDPESLATKITAFFDGCAK